MNPESQGHRTDQIVHELVITEGTRADYAALAQHHYRAGPPATWARILRATERESGVLIGVLVASMPTLNGAWRARAWPDWPAHGSEDPRTLAARINRELRVISRVVVAPAWRGVGLGRALVRAYLDDPLSPRTEAVAAMGAFCPVFRAAGMREVEVQPTRRDIALEAVLLRAGFEPWRLIDESTRRSALQRRDICEAAEAWGRSHRLVRDRFARTGELDHTQILALAASRLCAVPRAYVAERV